MPRKYTRKTSRGAYEKKNLEAAVEAVGSGRMGLRLVAREFNAPKSTIKKPQWR